MQRRGSRPSLTHIAFTFKDRPYRDGQRGERRASPRRSQEHLTRLRRELPGAAARRVPAPTSWSHMVACICPILPLSAQPRGADFPARHRPVHSRCTQRSFGTVGASNQAGRRFEQEVRRPASTSQAESQPQHDASVPPNETGVPIDDGAPTAATGSGAGSPGSGARGR